MSIAIPPEASRSVAGMSPQNESTEVNNRLARSAARPRRPLAFSELAQPFARTRAARERARGGFTPRAPARAGAKVISERG